MKTSVKILMTDISSNIHITERSSSVLIITEEAVGKINKHTDIGCDDFENHFTISQRELWNTYMKEWLVDYIKEPLSNFICKLSLKQRTQIIEIFPNPSLKTIYWMPNLITVCKQKSRCSNTSIDDHIRNEIKSIDIKIISQDMHQLKTRPVMYKTNSVMIDDLKVSLANIDSIYMKHIFNKSIKNQSKLIKMFLMDLDLGPDYKIKADVNINIGWEIFKELYKIVKVMNMPDMPSLYKYSIFIIRNADAFLIKLIDIEYDSIRSNPEQHIIAHNTMIEFWRRALMKKIQALRLPEDEYNTIS